MQEKSHARLYQHEFEDLLLRAALLQEEAVRVRALEDTPRLQQLAHAVLDEARVRRRAVAWLGEGDGRKKRDFQNTHTKRNQGFGVKVDLRQIKARLSCSIFSLAVFSSFLSS